MKKILVIALGLLLFSGAAFALPFTLVSGDLIGFNIVTGDTTADGVTTSDLSSYGVASMAGDVGYSYQITKNDIDGDGFTGRVFMTDGLNYDLSVFDSFEQQVFNDNDDNWAVSIMATIAGSNYYSFFADMIPGASSSVALGLANFSASDLSNVQLSLVVEYGASNFSSPDYFHVSAAPVPEPATLLLLGSGLVGLAFLKRRKS